jgi:hypothetical protein
MPNRPLPPSLSSSRKATSTWPTRCSPSHKPGRRPMRACTWPLAVCTCRSRRPSWAIPSVAINDAGSTRVSAPVSISSARSTRSPLAFSSETSTECWFPLRTVGSSICAESDASWHIAVGTRLIDLDDGLRQRGAGHRLAQHDDTLDAAARSLQDDVIKALQQQPNSRIDRIALRPPQGILQVFVAGDRKPIGRCKPRQFFCHIHLRGVGGRSETEPRPRQASCNQ